jgi:hypothetical protein
LWIALHRDLSRLPDDGVKVEVDESVARRQRLGVRTLSGP